MAATAQMQQIRLGTGPLGYVPIEKGIGETNAACYEQDHDSLKDTLLGLCPAHLWHNGSYEAGCPRPILIGKHHQQQMELLHEALVVALKNIVPRWFSDVEARFPERMPLEKDEEELLKWLDQQVLLGNLPPFAERLGSWRPDFLVEDHTCSQTGSIVENFRVTEINARFSFNGFMHEAYGQHAVNKALSDAGARELGLVSATDPEMIVDGLFSLFNPTLPLHLLKGEENGIDIHMFVDAVQRRFGIKPRLITPAELRLLPDPQASSGHRLCCLYKGSGDEVTLPNQATLFTTSDGELVEEIRQVGLELHQREFAAMQPEVLREISLRCFNDMRTILLVHDKRMLGIVRQEIPRLVAHHVLTAQQGDALARGITNTLLPGSEELEELIHACKEAPELRHEYILKPIRSGKGAGIVFGDDLDNEQWVASLERLRCPKVVPGVSCVIQRKIVPRVYDVILKASGDMVSYPLVGTWHASNGQLLGLGTWRSSGNRIVAVSCGGAWICSVIRQD
ncbi:unnamed protein product [Clonostachys solani]|uniref:Uncharacterized protein n=1 Tax=Clonostachys solani TaxID=160281 RepID=A0A9P0ENW5_9HYPO|nr:unnamed protein product [Clonostachys solani]